MTEELDLTNMKVSNSEESKARLETSTFKPEDKSMIDELIGGKQIWCVEILKRLDMRDLATLYMTSQRCREISLDAAVKRTALDGSFSSEEVLRCPEFYASWFTRVPSLGLEIEEVLWSSDDDALTVEDIETAERMVRTGQLPGDFITRKVDNIKESLVPCSKLPIVTTAASMAKMGLLSSVEDMTLDDVDISSIPPENMSALCSIVTDFVRIDNVTGDTIPVLHSLKCRQFEIFGMTLDTDDTRALVTAMTHGVETVGLWYDVSLDINVLTQYDGKGKCSSVECGFSIKEKYWANIRQWANTVGWFVHDMDDMDDWGYVDRNEKP